MYVPPGRLSTECPPPLNARIGTEPLGVLADVIGDLEFILPGIAVPPDDVVVSGVLRVPGDVDSDVARR